MKSKINYNSIIILLIMFLINLTSVKASDTEKLFIEAKKISKEAYLKFDVSLFLKANGIYERILSAEPENHLAKYYISYNQYRIINAAMVKNDLSTFENYYNTAIENLMNLKNNDQIDSEVQTLLAAIYMMKLAIDQSDAPSLSAAIHNYLGNAEQADLTNPRVHLIRGSMLLNTPEMFGGSVDGAISSFDKAIMLFEKKNKTKNQIDWGYAETLAWKGQALTEKDDIENAITTYEKALDIEPNYGWVKFRLLPALINKSKTTSLK